MMQVRDLDGR